MARARTITDEQILDAALAVFMEDGAAATTATIAERAGISEASIFKRFGTKQALFCAALRPKGPPEWLQTMHSLAGRGTVAENLRDLGTALVGFFRAMMPRLMLLWSEQVPLDMWKVAGEKHPAVGVVRCVADYVRAEITLGRLEDSDPLVTARIFVGAVAHFVFGEIAGFSETFDTDTDAYLDRLVALVAKPSIQEGRADAVDPKA